MQQRQLAGVLLRYSHLFPIPGSTLTGHTDAVNTRSIREMGHLSDCTPPDVTSEDEERGRVCC